MSTLFDDPETQEQLLRDWFTEVPLQLRPQSGYFKMCKTCGAIVSWTWGSTGNMAPGLLHIKWHQTQTWEEMGVDPEPEPEDAPKLIPVTSYNFNGAFRPGDMVTITLPGGKTFDYVVTEDDS